MMMRTAFGLVLVALLTGTAAAQPGPDPNQKVRVAVMDLSGSALRMQMATTGAPGQPMQPQYQQPGTQTTVSVAIPPPAEFARGLTEMLTTILVGTTRFTVLERSTLQQIEQEQMIGQTKTTKETAAQQGAMLGAQALITGDITAFAFNKSSIGGSVTNLVKGLGAAAERVTAEVVIDLRLIDATSGQVLASARGKGKASQNGIAADLIKGEKSYSSEGNMATPLGKASRQALSEGVRALLATMPAMRWSARVVDVRDGVVYLGAAGSDGVRPGLELEVYEIGEALTDPGTGQSLGAPEKFLGVVKVETVLEKFSTASVISGVGIGRGHVVRLKGATPR
jgi:curli biogenesis system outer membrane secretion channel CsgG